MVVRGQLGQPQAQPDPSSPQLTTLQQGLQVCLWLGPVGLAYSDTDLHTLRCQGLQLPEDLLALGGGKSL